MGWGVDRHMRADLYDAINLNTKATGSWKKGKAPDIPAWPRPTREEQTPKRVTVADVYARFTSRR